MGCCGLSWLACILCKFPRYLGSRIPQIFHQFFFSMRIISKVTIQEKIVIVYQRGQLTMNIHFACQLVNFVSLNCRIDLSFYIDNIPSEMKTKQRYKHFFLLELPQLYRNNIRTVTLTFFNVLSLGQFQYRDRIIWG